MMKMCDRDIERLELPAFITEQEVMSVYKIKERLPRQKPLLMRQMTLEKHLKKSFGRVPPQPQRTRKKSHLAECLLNLRGPAS